MWTAAAAERGTTIHRVRMHGAAGLDALSARLRAGRAIEQVAGNVTLPAGAILCVRRLRDPRPGQLRLSRSEAAPAAWTRAVEQALADLASRAAHPASGSVAAGAEAVIFDDRAQMLACLAADWCRGAIASQWWWRALLGALSEAEAVLRAWRRHPEYIAAALEDMARRRDAVMFVRRLPEASTAALLEDVVAAHGLSPRVVSTVTGDATPPAPPAEPRAAAAQRSPQQAAIMAAEIWQRSAPEALVDGLRTDQQVLLGVALTLRRDPARARDHDFVRDVVRWHAVSRRADAPRATREPELILEFPPHAIDSPHHVTRTSGPIAAAPTNVIHPKRVPLEQETRAAITPIVIEPASPTPASAIDDAAGHVARAVRGGIVAVETEIGGVFYLLNVALALGLYADFTAPLGPRLDASIWRFISLVGRGLLRGGNPDDPLWSLLIDLAGPVLPDGRDSGSTFDRLIRGHTRRIRARVARSLDVPVSRAGALLCRHHAHVRASLSHVDVTFSLAALPIAIRLAGLDRDPGWIPAADRIVSFRYE